MRQRSAGRWELVVSTGRDPSTGRYGRVIRTVDATSKRAAKAALAQLEAEVARGWVGIEDPSLEALLHRWLAHLRRLGRSEATLYNYGKYVDRELVPVLGQVRLSKLTAHHLDSLYADLSGRGLAPATVRQIHAIVRAALNQGMRWGLVGRNVATLASAPGQPQREQHPPTAEQVQDLIASASSIDPLFGLYVRVVAATGMRRAEACGLRWSDVDLDAGTLRIERSHLSLPGITGDRPTKTRTARTVMLDPGTLQELRAGWRRAREVARFGGLGDEQRISEYVFSSDPTGQTAWRGDVVTARWNRARRLAGVEGVRLHDLRHWQATQLLDAGVPVPTVAARLGHADGTTTMRIYAHRTQRGDEQAAEVVARALDGPA
jgi:integrase